MDSPALRAFEEITERDRDPRTVIEKMVDISEQEEDEDEDEEEENSEEEEGEDEEEEDEEDEE